MLKSDALGRPKSLKKRICFKAFAHFRCFCKNVEFVLDNLFQNGAKIDARIIKHRYWAAKGGTNVDLEYFSRSLGSSRRFNDFSNM